MIQLIASVVGRKQVLGKDGGLVWSHPDDLARFKRLTMGGAVVMGRGTWESLPTNARPLTGRRTIVLTSQPITLPEGVLRASSLTEAFALAKGLDVWVIGGERVYQEALPFADRVFLTHVETEIEGDRFFPELPRAQWRLTSTEQQAGFRYETFVRGTHVLLEGADGVGKSTALGAIIQSLGEQRFGEVFEAKTHVFDAVAFEQEHARIPTLQDLLARREALGGRMPILVIGEPGYAAPRHSVREALASKPGSADARDQVVMSRLFAEDRKVLYTELVLPAIAADPSIVIVQGRGLLSSLVYQAASIAKASGGSLDHAIEEILALEGNALELAHPPSDIVIMTAPPAVAADRMRRRDDAPDAFEGDARLQELVHTGYDDARFLAPFTSQGTTCHRVDANVSPQDVAAAVRQAMERP
ncbi:MAG: dihydrofolate reductase [Patescibacteria group bacterium]|nr:dihydrofolate reductase [Patescibacteria group bacterium]